MYIHTYIFIAKLAKSEKCHNKAKNDGTAAVLLRLPLRCDDVCSWVLMTH